MGRIKSYHPVKLIVGFIYKEGAALEQAKSLLIKRFGKIDFESDPLPFTHTDYYEKEFGKDLLRKFISFQKLIQADKIPEIKVFTNKTEAGLSKGSKRTINIDPGYLDLSKLVLATTKDFTHRVYLKKGIFSEVTLFYQNKAFKPWPWTYPDYSSQEYIEIFNRLRAIYDGQINDLSFLLKSLPRRAP